MAYSGDPTPSTESIIITNFDSLSLEAQKNMLKTLTERCRAVESNRAAIVAAILAGSATTTTVN